MTLQYNIVFGLLICEVFALVILLLLPSKPRKMLVQFTATSQLFQKLKVGAMVAFVVVAILFLGTRRVRCCGSGALSADPLAQIRSRRPAICVATPPRARGTRWA